MTTTGEPSAPDHVGLGAAVREAREAAGLSVRAAARAADISETRWRQIEAGYQRIGDAQVPVRPSVKTLAAMAVAVGESGQRWLVLAGHERALPHWPRRMREAWQEAERRGQATVTEENSGPQVQINRPSVTPPPEHGYVAHRHEDDEPRESSMSDEEVLALIHMQRRLADELERRIKGDGPMGGTGAEA